MSKIFNISAIIKRLQDNDKDLTELNINSEKITLNEIKSLAAALAKNRFLKILDFSNNFIGSEGVQALAKSLETNKVLHSIYLRSNNAGDDGAKALAMALRKNSSLQNLYLGNNKISHVGVEAIANTLSFNSTLEILSFRNNEVGNEACKVLADNLAVNATLKTLNLANTGVTNNGAAYLLRILDVNTNLLDVKLSYNEINDQEILENLAACFHYNNSQNTTSVNAVAKKIIIYCEEYLTQEEMGERRLISNENLEKKYGLGKEDLYYISHKNSHGGAVLCLASLYRMALNRYSKDTVDIILQTSHKLCPILFSHAKEEELNQEVEKPNAKISALATAALDKVTNIENDDTAV